MRNKTKRDPNHWWSTEMIHHAESENSINRAFATTSSAHRNHRISHGTFFSAQMYALINDPRKTLVINSRKSTLLARNGIVKRESSINTDDLKIRSSSVCYFCLNKAQRIFDQQNTWAAKRTLRSFAYRYARCNILRERRHVNFLQQAYYE